MQLICRQGGSDGAKSAGGNDCAFEEFTVLIPIFLRNRCPKPGLFVDVPRKGLDGGRGVQQVILSIAELGYLCISTSLSCR